MAISVGVLLNESVLWRYKEHLPRVDVNIALIHCDLISITNQLLLFYPGYDTRLYYGIVIFHHLWLTEKHLGA